MKALVVFDSFFGNTEAVAREVGKALGHEGEVAIIRIGEVTPEHLTGLTHLVVGSPTRAFSPSPETKKFLRSIPRHGLKGVLVAAFDTRIDVDEIESRILPPMVKAFGYAAEPIAERLEKKDGERAHAPAGFIVEGTEGPLRAGELERAAAWARQIAASGSG